MSDLQQAWAIARPYWWSREKWSARGLLAAIVTLNLASVAIDVRLNTWRGAFYDAVQNYDAAGFFLQLAVFAALAAAWIMVTVYASYLAQVLEIRWRRWLTDWYLDDWLADQAYYRIQLRGGATDNPDQRISEDLASFCRTTLGLTIGLLNAIVTLGSFLFILWSLSGPLRIPLAGWGSVTVPGYMLWVALIYAVIGTWLTVKVGNPLISLSFTQQRFEADFRYSLMRLRENAESIAFYKGEARERATFRARFARVFDNYWKMMVRNKKLAWLTSGYDQIAVVFPYVAAAPRYFSHAISLGVLMRVASAFAQVQRALSYIVVSYTSIAQWQAVVQRLAGFRRDLRRVEEDRGSPIIVLDDEDGLVIEQLHLDLPDGQPLKETITLSVPPGVATLITGASGAGKSTLLRAIAGLWPFGQGRIHRPRGTALFLPQRPYIPLGTLRDALLFPGSIPRDTDSIVAALQAVGLGNFVGELDHDDRWAQRLSIGEQQRLAFARVLLTRPQVVFLDEATSALDEVSERELYATLRNAPWGPLIISIGHRSALRGLHDRIFDIDHGRVQPPAAKPGSILATIADCRGRVAVPRLPAR